jgi:DNA-binding NtrC family response regulator
MPARILVSWVAWYTDFIHDPESSASLNGPNYSLHQSYYTPEKHLKHILLSSGEEGEARSLMLAGKLEKDFPEHTIELIYLNLMDPLDFQEIKARATYALQPYQKYPLDVLISTGTTPMRMSWLLLKLEKNEFDIHMVQSLDPLLATNSQAHCIDLQLETSDFAYRLELIRKQTAEQSPVGNLYQNDAIKAVYQQARQLALHPHASGIIGGESGSGKEKLAQYIHKESARHQHPFIAINCAGIGQDILESRLFGYRKGAFTGAEEDRKGFFEEADGGTLLLDEIGDMPSYVQQALLRVLETKCIQRVGESRERKIDVRILAASHRDLWARCEQGKFRRDLFFRLAEVELQLPSWNSFSYKDREACLHQMNLQHAQQSQRRPLKMTPELLVWFSTWTFSGNFREIKQLLSRFYILCQEEEVGLEYLPLRYRHHTQSDLTLASMRAIHIQKVWAYCDHNISRTARSLGIAVNTLKKDLRSYGLLP